MAARQRRPLLTASHRSMPCVVPLSIWFQSSCACDFRGGSSRAPRLAKIATTSKSRIRATRSLNALDSFSMSRTKLTNQSIYPSQTDMPASPWWTLSQCKLVPPPFPSCSKEFDWMASVSSFIGILPTRIPKNSSFGVDRHKPVARSGP